MDFTGKIIAALEPRTGVSKATNSEWKVQEFVIESHDMYPKKMCFEVFGADKLQQFNIQVGEEMTISFDIDARQWQNRWFNSIRVWNVNRATSQQPAAAQPLAPQAAPAQSAATPAAPFAPQNDAMAATDDLPF